MDLGTTKAEESGKWRFANKKAFFTYKTMIDKNKILAFFGQWLDLLGGGRVEIAHEIGESGYKHTHVYVDFGRRMETQNVRFFDYEGIHPNISFVKTALHFNNVLKYLVKYDKENEHLLKEVKEKPHWLDEVMASGDRKSAARCAKKPSDLLGVMNAYNMFERRHVVDPIRTLGLKLRPWQIDMETLTKDPCSIGCRKIRWVFDPPGTSGKSRWAQHMIANDPDMKWISVDDGGGQKDMATLIRGVIHKDWQQHGIIFDFSRDMENHQFYRPLEGIKNGKITTQKWEGETLYFRIPHVIVLANFLPDAKRLSLDRWDVWFINWDYTHKPEGPPEGTPDYIKMKIHGGEFYIPKRDESKLLPEARTEVPKFGDSNLNIKKGLESPKGSKISKQANLFLPDSLKLAKD